MKCFDSKVVCDVSIRYMRQVSAYAGAIEALSVWKYRDCRNQGGTAGIDLVPSGSWRNEVFCLTQPRSGAIVRLGAHVFVTHSVEEEKEKP